MTHLIRNLLLVTLVLSSHQSGLADDLFSEITIGSVFSGSVGADRDTASSTYGNGRRLTGATSIRSLLTEAGFRSDELDSKSVKVVVAAPQTKEKVLKIVVAVNVDKERIVMTAPLVQIDEAKTSARSLLQLMAAGRNGNGIYFNYSTTDKWVGVQRIMTNKDVSPGMLKAKIDELVGFARGNAATWQSLDSNEVTEKKRRRASASADSFSLAGSWNATGSKNETYSIQFANKRFTLGISMNGQISRSEGTWSMQNNRLTLSGEGINLSGTVTISSDNRFILQIKNQNALTFTKIAG
jgi:hypothetical protein